MTTALDLIQDSVERLGVYAPGETMTAADSARGLIVLNDLVDEWSDEFLYIYDLVPTTITLVAAQGSYTIGVTGTPSIAQQRPVRISMGPGQATATIAAVETPVNVVSAVEWNAIESIASGVGTPDTLFYDARYPNGVLNLAPVPDAIGDVVFQAWSPVTVFASLFDPDVNFSPGTLETLKSNLAVKLKTYFTAAVIDPVVAAGAITGKQNLRHTNLLSRAMIGRTGVPQQTARS